MEKYSTLKIFEVEVVKVAEMVEVIKVTVTKKSIMRRDCQAKQIGVEEDAVEEEVVDQTFSAINDCLLHLKDGVMGSIQDVYYVPDLKTNILSMGKLTENSYSIFLKDHLLHLKDKEENLVARVEIRRNRMYKLNLRSMREKCLRVDVEDKASL